MRRNRIELVMVGLVWLGVAGCRSEKPEGPAAAPAVAPAGTPTNPAPAPPSPVQEASAPAVVPKPASKPPRRYEEPPVDQDATGAVRGPQMVDFIVMAQGKAVEGAQVSVRDARGEAEAKGKTSDWGEFHAALHLGRYKVSVEWNGQTVVQDVTVDDATNRVQLKLTATGA